jgi:LPS-assembly lipoprotein
VKIHILPILGALLLGLVLSGCQVRPLNSPSTMMALKNVTVAPVNERVAQQVRNRLIFGLTGGKGNDGARYSVKLKVSTSSSTAIVRQITAEPTASNVTVGVNYTLTDTETNAVITKGKRVGVAAYDRTTQNFANLRSQRNAENRAAKEAAEQIRIAIATALSGR